MLISRLCIELKLYERNTFPLMDILHRQFYHYFTMIRSVFFDIYGTIAGFHPSRYDVQSRACLYFGIEVSPEGIIRGYADADEYMSMSNSIHPLHTLDSSERDGLFAEYERLVLAGSGIEVSLDTAIKIFRKVQTIPHDLAIFDDVIPCLDRLKLIGLTIGIISNMDHTPKELVSDLGLHGRINFMVTSGQVGVAKPHPKIFQSALSSAGVKPEEAVHVGDQLISDIQGAAEVGINPILIDRDGNHRKFTKYPYVTTLKELPDALQANF